MKIVNLVFGACLLWSNTVYASDLDTSDKYTASIVLDLVYKACKLAIEDRDNLDKAVETLNNMGYHTDIKGAEYLTLAACLSQSLNTIAALRDNHITKGDPF